MIGIIFGVLAAIAGLIDFLGNRLIRVRPPAWPHMVGNFVVLLLAVLNTLVHSRDAWTSVVPVGLILFDHRRSDPARHGMVGLVDGLSLRRGEHSRWGSVQMTFTMLKTGRTMRLASCVLMCGAAFCLTGCNDQGGDPRAQTGPHPNLPEQSQYLSRRCTSPGWSDGRRTKRRRWREDSRSRR